MRVIHLALFLLSISATAFTPATLLADEPPMAFKITEGPELPIAVGSHACGSIDGYPVVAGGSHWTTGPNKQKSWRTECFIFRDGAWSAGPALPSGLAEMAYASDGHSLVIAGGNNAGVATPDALILRSVDGNASWEQLPSLPVAVNGACGALVDGVFYVIGGLVAEANVATVWSLDLNDHSANWKACAPLPSVRSYAGAAVIDNSIYVFGGYVAPQGDQPAAVQADACRYDHNTGSWERLQNWNLRGYCWATIAVNDHQILLAGQAALEDGISGPVRLVDVQTMTWQPIGQLVNPTCAMGAIKVNDTTWWIPGGEPDANRNRTARTTIIERTSK